MSWDWEELKKQQQAKRNSVDLNESSKKKRFDASVITEFLPVVGYLILAVVLVIIFWYIARWANYKFSYEKKFQQVVIEMVKPEALKDKYKKGVDD